jgi:hypothetical protein
VYGRVMGLSFTLFHCEQAGVRRAVPSRDAVLLSWRKGKWSGDVVVKR